MKQKIIFALIGLAVGVIGGGLAGYFVGLDHGVKKSISTYEECVAAGYPAQESHPARCVTPDGKGFEQVVSDQGRPITVDGNVICLLHKDTDGPQTLECAIGLKASDGKYYSLSSEIPDNSLASAAGSDRKVRVMGTFKEESSDRYQSEGVITVSSFEFIQ